MSCESDLRTVVQALLDLTSEVAILQVRLTSVEKRVTKIEQASSTPTASPALSPQAVAHADGDLSLASAPPPPQPTAPDEGDISSTLVSQKEHSFCDTSPRDLGSEIQRHVKPLEATLSGITNQLSRIENAITQLAPTATFPATTSSTLTHRDCHSSPEQPSDKKLPANPPETQATAQKTPKLRPGPAAPPEDPQPVFGRASTPRARVASPTISLDGSPFGDYSSEKSPFAQLVKRKGARSAFDTINLVSKDPFKRVSTVQLSLGRLN